MTGTRRSILVIVWIAVVSLELINSSCTRSKPAKTPVVEIFDKVYPPLNYRLIGSLINGKKEGLWVTLDSTGKTEMEETYLNGKEFGALKIYSNGFLVANSSDKIIHGDTVSAYEKYNAQGVVVIKGQYMNSKKRGIWLYYFNNGKSVKAKIKFTENGSSVLFKSPSYFKEDY